MNTLKSLALEALVVETDGVDTDSVCAVLDAMEGVSVVTASPDYALFALDVGASLPRICVVGLGDDHDALRDLLHALSLKYPGIARALIVTDGQRQTAIDWINDDVVDRYIMEDADYDAVARHCAALATHAARVHALRELLIDDEPKHLFVTGATGFLGGQLVREVLRSTNHTITALTRGYKQIPFDQRLPYREEDYAGRLRFVEGDIGEPGLGLTEEQAESLSESIDEVWHLAAITYFDEILREKIFKANLEGTENIVAFAMKMKRLHRLHHISTAYVAGTRSFPEVIPEAVLEQAKSFKNPYEESKFLAECRVVESGLPAIIHRPSIVMGESVSGRSDGQTVYNIAKMVRLAKMTGDQDCLSKGLPLTHHTFRVAANPDAGKNLVPVDDVISMMLNIAHTNPEPSAVFHVTHPEPTPIGDLVEVIAGILDTHNYAIVDSLEGEALSVPEEVLQRVAEVFTPYMINGDPLFDQEQVRARIGALDVPTMDLDHLRFCIHSFYEQFFGVGYADIAVRT